MPTPQPTTRRLQGELEDALAALDQHGRAGLISAGAWSKLRPRLRVACRLADRADNERRALIGLVTYGRVPRDVAAALAALADDDPDPIAA
jgi:hypothetical protein